MFGLKRADDITMMPMQKQEGLTDCGVFAIFVMTSLAHDEDPCRINYKQSKLRGHLVLFHKKETHQFSMQMSNYEQNIY